MYTRFFNLHENPFSIAPDPRYLYMSRRHQEALAHLLYGVGRGGGFVALTGEVGTGKTTLCHCLLEQLPDDVDVALLLNPRLDAVELLASLCDELNISYPHSPLGREDSEASRNEDVDNDFPAQPKGTRQAGGASLKILVDLLNDYLLDAHAHGRRTVVMIDEAQNLSFDVLEQIRLLTNLETPQTKLLQIILVGQPELHRLLERRELRQLRQRITARYHLVPLSFQETADYIGHRLAVSGGAPDIFTRSAIRTVYRQSGGIPRLINTICDRALLGAYAANKRRVTAGIARRAAAEILAPWPSFASRRLGILIGLLTGIAAVGAAIHFGRSVDEHFLLRLFGQAETIATPTPAPAAAATEPATLKQPKAAPVAPVEPSVPRKSFEELLDDPGLTFETALGRLLRNWGITDESVAPDCNEAVQHGLKCLPLHDTWNGLKRLDRPAVLEFSLPDGEKRFVALTGLDKAGAILEFGDRRETVPLAEVLAAWQGYAAILWRPLSVKETVLAAGTRSPAVVVLRRLLNAVDGRGDVAAAPERFDTELKWRVEDFQGSRGLAEDGIVGPQTFIHLENVADAPGIPKLNRTGE